ncbi:SET domain [Cinara cedri]|uniref:SET domain n=1 Tax=Cinara cedri TaxID=506608 RepID=A0A5E4NTL4_9HEMI|nr:SET domain [Cinara cedri]
MASSGAVFVFLTTVACVILVIPVKKKCGWGVKASRFIRQGEFIAIYTGKLITVEESKTRLKEDASLSEYMWNLDFDKRNYDYIIDGSNMDKLFG